MSATDPSRALPGLTVFIGGGNMARSLIAGLRRQGVAPERIAVAEPQPQLREALAAEFGIAAAEDGSALVSSADLLVLAVKPQVMADVCRSLAGKLKSGAMAVSIAAGVPCVRLQEWLGTSAVVRSMPNTPALLGAGATGLYAPAGLGSAQRAAAEALMGSAGFTVWIEREELMDVVTALSGSGPAYFFLLVEALVDAAVAHGLPADSAQALATHTALGAARMLVESGEPAAELRRRVTSPGGTTHAAVSAFEAGGLGALVQQAVHAAVERGRELAG
jgi:pyrroline-5-carboxylate reductase